MRPEHEAIEAVHTNTEQACNNAFSSATTYNHAQTEQWNSEIIVRLTL